MYKIKKIITSSGERLPFFLNKEGMPVYDVTIYLLCELRARNLSSNAIMNVLAAIKILYLYLYTQQYDLVELIRNEKIVSMEVIESLSQFSKRKTSDIITSFSEKKGEDKYKIFSLEKRRKRETVDNLRSVHSSVSVIRLIYIKKFIYSFMTRVINNTQFESVKRKKLIELRDNFSVAIDSRIPSIGRRIFMNGRVGLSENDAKEFLRVISPASEDNPWNNEYVKVRNELMLLLLYHLGVRRGEILSIRTLDVLFQEGTLTVHRSADDPKDPRIDQPVQKTGSRKLPLNEDMLQKIQTYIQDWRSQGRLAHKNLFLFTTENGTPLSISAFTKIFKVLRIKCPQLPRDLFAHILRHTWNTRLSELADTNNMAEHEEIKIRSYLMGWSGTSGTAALYTKRHIEKKANSASLKMQENLDPIGGSDEANIPSK